MRVGVELLLLEESPHPSGGDVGSACPRRHHFEHLGPRVRCWLVVHQELLLGHAQRELAFALPSAFRVMVNDARDLDLDTLRRLGRVSRARAGRRRGRAAAIAARSQSSCRGRASDARAHRFRLDGTSPAGRGAATSAMVLSRRVRARGAGRRVLESQGLSACVACRR
jgi:hypothetical protein